METVRQPRSTVDIEIPADRVCTISSQCVERINRIALGLTHLLAVLILNVTQYNNILIWCLVKQQGRDRKQGVEPASGLVNRLGNEICRELLLKKFFILKWIVMLCKWHRTGIEPAVDHLRHTFHLLAALRTCDGDCINVWTVKLDVIRTIWRHGLQLLNASDGMLMSALTLPYV